MLPVVFGALVFKLSVWCEAEGYVSGLRAAAAAPNTTGSNQLYNTLELLMMGIWCPKYVEQAIRSAIKIICCIQLEFYFYTFSEVVCFPSDIPATCIHDPTRGQGNRAGSRIFHSECSVSYTV